MTSPKKSKFEPNTVSLESAFGIRVPMSMKKSKLELLEDISPEVISSALSPTEVAKTLHISLKTLQNRMAKGDGYPPFIVLPCSNTKVCPQPWFKEWLQAASTIIRPSGSPGVS